MLTLAHVTDPHIAGEGELIRGIDSRRKFSKLLETLSRRSLDGIILTGDLTASETDEETLRWIKEKLDALDLPYVITPGNHDTPALLQEVFNLPNLPPRVILTGAVAMRGESLMFLDSSSERLELKQKLWLSRELETQPQRSILFMHHPPRPCGEPLMDERYPYKTPDLFRKALEESGRELTVFCGHYHMEKSLPAEGGPLTLHLTPAVLGSFEADASGELRVNGDATGWREIDVEKQRVSRNECFYLERA